MAVVVKKPITKKRQKELERLTESVYDSPESDGECYLNKRFRPNGLSYTSKDTFTKLNVIEAQALVKKFQNSYTDEIPTKIPSTNFRDLSSLIQGRIVDESCINDWAKHLINVFNISESVLYIPTYLYRYLFKTKIDDSEGEKIIRYLANNKAIKKDYILVGMPATPTSQHWILGVILLNVRKIMILDPTDYSPGLDSRHFSNLLRITLAAHKLANIELKLDHWKLYLPKNIPRANDTVNAGVRVCYYIFKIAFQQPLTSLPDTSFNDYRRRIHYVLSSAKEILPQGDAKKYPRETLSQYIQYLSQKFAPFSRYVDVGSFDEIVRDAVPRMSVGECADQLCVQALTSCSDFDQVKCISCRKYFHSRCEETDTPVDYFICTICVALF